MFEDPSSGRLQKGLSIRAVLNAFWVFLWVFFSYFFMVAGVGVSAWARVNKRMGGRDSPYGHSKKARRAVKMANVGGSPKGKWARAF